MEILSRLLLLMGHEDHAFIMGIFEDMSARSGQLSDPSQIIRLYRLMLLIPLSFSSISTQRLEN